MNRTPCYLTVFEQLTWPRQMAAECVRLGCDPIILDNGSTYPPLLEWLDACPYEVIRVGHNASCYGFWHAYRHHDQTGLYVVSDSDLDLSTVPNDAIERLTAALIENPDIPKAGLSLEIEDIPETYKLRDQVMQYERPCWHERRGDAWLAGIGATFALYDPSRNDLLEENFYPAIRLDRPYTARHLPWYLDLDHMSDELRYYFERCDNVCYYGSRTRDAIQENRT